MADDLESKYGRRKSSQSDDSVEYKGAVSDSPVDENEAKYGRRSATFTKKTQADKAEVEKEKEIKSNIQNVIHRYSKEHEDLSAPATARDEEAMVSNKSVASYSQETPLVKALKAIISLIIIGTVVCIIVAFMMKPQINVEGGQIIDQIKRAEDLYYTKVKKYHYFSQTNYDHTLGIDLSKYKYFTSYEVVRSEKTGNYEAKIYGATNAFTITFYAIKAWISGK